MPSASHDIATYQRLYREIGEALEAQTLTAEIAGKLDRFELLHATLPAQERGGESLTPTQLRDVSAMIERLRQRVRLELSGAGKLKAIPYSFTRPRCGGSCRNGSYR